jgi:hypothetical protein
MLTLETIETLIAEEGVLSHPTVRPLIAS